MSNTPPPYHLDHLEKIADMFAQLSQQDVEEFYLSYQYWYLQQQIETLQNGLNQTRRMMIENTVRIQQVQPTAIELATLARLQSNGVSDLDLLDRMLERGEAWLDRTMQRLDYLEQLDDFIRDNYTQWCNHALEGAYDWIDSVLDRESSSPPEEASQATSEEVPEDVKHEELIDATEELFLQKISTEDELQANEITSKRASISSTDVEEVISPSEDINRADHQEETQVETIAEEEPPTIENSKTPAEAQSPVQEPIDTVNVTQTPSRLSTQRPGLVKRFLGKIWGS